MEYMRFTATIEMLGAVRLTPGCQSVRSNHRPYLLLPSQKASKLATVNGLIYLGKKNINKTRLLNFPDGHIIVLVSIF
jgi:CMP-N-acetylneuraminic acid synthetase